MEYFFTNWLQSPKETFENDIWGKEFDKKGKYQLLWEYLPQPYLGDPENCSVVTLNLNPGPVDLNPKPESNFRRHDGGKLVAQLRSIGNYVDYAKTFPQKKIDKASKRFWDKQFNWIDAILEIEGIKSNRLPFAMEVCPWHSKNWKNDEFSEKLPGHIEENVFDVVDEVVKNAQIKIVFSVGKSYYDLFYNNGFTNVFELTPDNGTEKLNGIKWPEMKKKEEPSKRFFSVWKREKSETLYFNTYSLGSNTPPSDKWREIQEYILKSVREY